MKKVLAIVLAVVMTLSMTVAAFAAVEVAPGQVFFGFDGSVTANPGETITVDVRFAGNPYETDEYPTDGYIVVPFMVISDVNVNSITGVSVAPDAAAAGIELYYNEDSGFNTYIVDDGDEIPGSGELYGTLLVPADMLTSDITILQVETKMADDWEVIDYVATYDGMLDMYAGEADYLAFYFISEEEADMVFAGDIMLDDASPVAEIVGAFSDDCAITAAPYQPTFIENLTEQLKALAASILDILVIGIGLLKGELETAPWYDPNNPAVDLSFITDALGALVGSLM